MKHRALATPDILDVTQLMNIELKHRGKPITVEHKKAHDLVITPIHEQLAPLIDVSKPAISIADMGYYAAILLNGMGIFYIGMLIGKAIGYLTD